MDEIFCALAYPTFIVVCSAMWYSLPADNREVMVPLH